MMSLGVACSIIPESEPCALVVEVVQLPLVPVVQHARALRTLRYELRAL